MAAPRSPRFAKFSAKASRTGSNPSATVPWTSTTDPTPTLPIRPCCRPYGATSPVAASDRGRHRAGVEAEGQLQPVLPHQLLVAQQVLRTPIGGDHSPGEHHGPRAQLPTVP